MKTIHKIPIIAVIAVAIFVIWSSTDTVCKPCIITPDAPENFACPTSCTPEPRWYDWFR
ncbi:hypothetical protein AAA799E16_02063 [Marine Group I thaumarchaeote SCGC AAA799-E16]|uniref:Uncharacterized protein n=1 Tax=Marine Group I thaumarchaeote SCGC AAA799-E16 TaxID=1502292 RepID=A0A081S2Z8_9ARCH|nr:hypothetical protein AAA799E16_02063 [Marine Group I thaumarchaeote SCGC AAA799-E16]